MQLINSKFCKISYLHDYQAIVLDWFEETKNMTESDMKELLAEFLVYVKKFKPVTSFQDMQRFYFLISPEMQAWIDENINKVALDNGGRNAIFIVPTDIFSQVSVEQAMNESGGKSFNVKYFDDKTKAFDYLKLLQ